MPSFGMFRVALVRADVSEELNASIIKLTRIGELGTTLAVTDNRCTLRRKKGILLIRIIVLVCMLNCARIHHYRC
jgi:hypothetical protein